jgi:thioredoxin reductase (NADPH)
MMRRKVIIIGSGPAGLTAALYTARANLNPLVFEGSQPGGQLTITTDVENFPGFPKGIMGPELVNLFRKQAIKFGAECDYKIVTKVDFSKRPFSVWIGESFFTAETVIISTGSTAKLLGLESEMELMGHGVSACATCDGFFFKGKIVLVVGGGDSAMEEALFLTKFASEVHIIHRRNEFRASKIMQKRVFDNDIINIKWNSVISKINGSVKEGVTGALLQNEQTNEEINMDCDGIFLAIGHTPNVSLFDKFLVNDEYGYLVTKEKTSETNIPGVFACGDVQDHRYKQAITAAGSGCMAAIDAERFIETHPID